MRSPISILGLLGLLCVIAGCVTTDATLLDDSKRFPPSKTVEILFAAPS